MCQVAPVCFCAKFATVAPRLAGARYGDGPLQPSIFPMLAGSVDAVFGREPFHDGGPRLAGFLATGLPLAEAFGAAWGSMRQLLPEEWRDSGPLAGPADQAGSSSEDSLQGAWTALLERAAAREYHDRVQSRPAGSVARRSWMSLNRYSTQWVSALPCGAEGEFDAAELATVAATYLGLEVPVFDGLVGRRIPGSGRAGPQSPA